MSPISRIKCNERLCSLLPWTCVGKTKACIWENYRTLRENHCLDLLHCSKHCLLRAFYRFKVFELRIHPAPQNLFGTSMKEREFKRQREGRWSQQGHLRVPDRHGRLHGLHSRHSRGLPSRRKRLSRRWSNRSQSQSCQSQSWKSQRRLGSGTSLTNHANLTKQNQKNQQKQNRSHHSQKSLGSLRNGSSGIPGSRQSQQNHQSQSQQSLSCGSSSSLGPALLSRTCFTLWLTVSHSLITSGPQAQSRQWNLQQHDQVSGSAFGIMSGLTWEQDIDDFAYMAYIIINKKNSWNRSIKWEAIFSLHVVQSNLATHSSEFAQMSSHKSAGTDLSETSQHHSINNETERERGREMESSCFRNHFYFEHLWTACSWLNRAGQIALLNSGGFEGKQIPESNYI